MGGNPLDWGNSPIVVGLVRGIISAIIAGLIAYFGAQGTGVSEDQARIVGYIAVLTPLAALFSLGGYDQVRANRGIIQAGDVPVVALSNADGSTPQATANVIEQATRTS